MLIWASKIKYLMTPSVRPWGWEEWDAHITPIYIPAIRGCPRNKEFPWQPRDYNKQGDNQRHGINITDLNSNPSSDWGSICAPPQHTPPQSFPDSPKEDIFFLQMFGLIKSPNSSIEKGKTETWQSVPCNKDGLCIIQQVVQHGAYISLYIWSQITSENRTWMFLTILSFFSYLIDFWIQLKVFTYCGREFHRLTICDIKGHFLYHFKIYCLLIELGILLCLFHKTG